MTASDGQLSLREGFGSELYPGLDIHGNGCILTESQHGRGWQGPLWVIWSNPLPKQGHLQ